MTDDALAVNSQVVSPPEGFEVAFLPWLGWEREIVVGPVSVSPFRLDSIPEPVVREYLRRYFPRYTDVDGMPVGAIALATHRGKVGFGRHTPEEKQALQRAVTALAIAFMVEAWRVELCHEHLMGVPSADSFQLIFQHFAAGSNFVAVDAGRSTQVWCLDEMSFTRPWSALRVWGQPDRYALEGLGSLLDKPDVAPSEFVERVWRSLEWFRLAHLDEANQTDDAKVVAMATAFESFFGLPDRGKQAEFAERVGRLVRDDEMQHGSRQAFKGKTINLSLAGCWAWDFYDLRSRLVHGNAVLPGAFTDALGFPHLGVADLVFRECVLRELFRFGCFGADVRQAASDFDNAFAEIPSGSEPFDAVEWVVNDRLHFCRIHQKLGWSRVATP